MRALGSDGVQADQCRNLRSHGGLGRFVIGDVGDDPLAGGGMLSIVDQFWRGISSGYCLKCFDLLLASFEEERESSGVANAVFFLCMSDEDWSLQVDAS